MPRLHLPPMSMRAAAAAVALLLVAAPCGILVSPAAAATGGSPVSPAGQTAVWTLDQDLARAKADSAAADAAFDMAKRVSTPGHLLDPLPASLMAGLGDLQAQYAEMERKAAGYRATLGEQHPTLKGAEEVLAELRGQILDGARRAAASAERDAARARDDVAALERRVRAADATGSIAAAVAKPPAVAMPSIPSESIPAISEPAPPARPTMSQAQSTASGTALAHSFAGVLPLVFRHLWLAAGLGFAVAVTVLWAMAAMTPSRRRRPSPLPATRIEPAAPVESPSGHPARIVAPATGSSGAAVETPPVLAAFPMAGDLDATAAAVCLARDPDGALVRAAAAVCSTLAAAAYDDPRALSKVLVAPAAGSPPGQADAAALAVAHAAAGAGRRVLLAEGQADGRLGRALAAGGAALATLEIDGQIRPVLRATVAGRVVAVLGAAIDAAAGSTDRRLPDLSVFDMVVVAGAPHRGSLLAADVALLVAPNTAEAAELAAAARVHAGDRNRPCGILVVERPQAETAEAASAFGPAVPRRRILADAPAARLGLRRTFEPTRRRA